MGDSFGAADGWHFGRHLPFRVDVNGCGAGHPTRQREFQEVAPCPVEASGRRDAEWETQARGDVLLAVLPERGVRAKVG